jgi:hypothetical protein
MKPVFLCDCCHEFVTDWIDLTLEKTIKIEYCILCGFTKK